MGQYQHLGVADRAQCHTEKVTHTDVDRHPHAVDGTTQHDALAVKFDTSYAAVRAYVMRIEADG
jgi:hypothetical protein